MTSQTMEIHAESVFDLEGRDLDERYDDTAMSKADLQRVMGFDFVSAAAHERDVLIVLELEAQGRLDALPTKRGCCMVS